MSHVCLTVDLEPDCPPYLDGWAGVERGMPQVLELFAGPHGMPEARTMRVALGRRMVALTLTVTTQPDGQRLGSTIEWRELTEELRAHVRNKLASYKAPREIDYVDEFPMTSSGKINRKALRQAEGN